MSETDPDRYRGAVLRGLDFSGATFRGCDFTGVRIVGSEVVDLTVSGHAGEIQHVVVNGVDVTGYVEAELDRRQPVRVQLRRASGADDLREVWAAIEVMWAVTMGRVSHLPEPARHERVDDEWSIMETLRHLVFATDTWISWMIGGEPDRYHPLGLPPGSYPPDGAAELGLDLAATPTFDEVVAARDDRIALARSAFAGFTDENLARLRTARPAPIWEELTLTVGQCARVVLAEEIEHHRYVERDLGELERWAEG